MTDAPARNCGECTFWVRLHEKIGVCRRHAPVSTWRPEEVAHWPETREGQVCGEGRVRGEGQLWGEGLVAAEQPGAKCVACIYWRRMATGMNPVDRGDMPKAWWARAGICVRAAPRPSAEPGPRAFWQATGDDDGCGDGVPRPSPAPAS